MATYNDLKPGYYYLVKQNENASIELVFIPMETNKCVLVEYQDEEQSMNWFKKTDPVFELVEQLTEEQALAFENLFDDEESGEDFEWTDDPEADGDWFSPDSDDTDEDDEKRRALNN